MSGIKSLHKVLRRNKGNKRNLVIKVFSSGRFQKLRYQVTYFCAAFESAFKKVTSLKFILKMHHISFALLWDYGTRWLQSKH